MLIFGGMQWRVAGWLSGIPFTTLHSAFARWTRLGLCDRLAALSADRRDPSRVVHPPAPIPFTLRS
jgi:hypothetical protein